MIVSQMFRPYFVDCASDSRKRRTFIFEDEANQNLPSINNVSAAARDDALLNVKVLAQQKRKVCCQQMK
jgi:hypothetical protein